MFGLLFLLPSVFSRIYCLFQRTLPNLGQPQAITALPSQVSDEMPWYRRARAQGTLIVLNDGCKAQGHRSWQFKHRKEKPQVLPVSEKLKEITKKT